MVFGPAAVNHRRHLERTARRRVDPRLLVGLISNHVRQLIAVSCPAPYAAELDALLSRDEVSGHELVYGEFVIGTKVGESSCSRTTRRCTRRAPSRRCRIRSFVTVAFTGGIGWIDAHLLASALVGRLKPWTTDPRLAGIARELGAGID